MNKVIAGDFLDGEVYSSFGTVSIQKGLFTNRELSRKTVEAYNIISDEQRKSAASGIARGAIGAALLGPAGLIGGALSAKNKTTYKMEILFFDGKQSLIEISEKIYKDLIKKIY